MMFKRNLWVFQLVVTFSLIFNGDALEENEPEKLRIDTAILTIKKFHSNQNNFALDIQLKSDECYECAFYSYGHIDKIENSSVVEVDTKWPTTVKLISKPTNCSVTFRYHFGEYGRYSVNFTSETSSGPDREKCFVSSIIVQDPPIQTNFPLLVAFLILLIVGLIYAISRWLFEQKMAAAAKNGSAKIRGKRTINLNLLARKRFKELCTVTYRHVQELYVMQNYQISASINDAENAEAEVVQTSFAAPKKRKRLGSIDTFRGLSLVVMIFVNYGGGKYWFFEHATWNVLYCIKVFVFTLNIISALSVCHGLTVADLVFPWFMFIMGVNIPFSVESLLKRNTNRWEIAYKVIRRTLILFALGLTAININTNWTGFRVPGVLQRFSIAYLFAFLIQWAFHKSPKELHKAATTESGRQKWWYAVRDIIAYWPQWIIVFLLEALWLLLTFLLPVPGCPTGYLGPGGLAENGKYINSNCIGGAAGYIDRWLLGENHIYGYPTPKAVYYPTSGDERVPFDPEGVLGSINGCIIVFFGSQMGKIFLYYDQPKFRIFRWICWGVLLGVVSIILCKASMNGGWIPVNKNLWTITFVTTLSCFAFFLMIAIYWIIDVLKLWSGSPFDYVGMNSIFLYVGHQTFSYYIPFAWGATEYSTHAEWLAMNMLGVFYWILIAYYCFKIKFFIKI